MHIGPTLILNWSGPLQSILGFLIGSWIKVLLDELLSEDNCLYKTTVLKENTDVINVLLFRDQAQLFEVFEASLSNFKEHVPPEYISWSL
jgi:hypothetical protein